ncbi:MAG: MBOAT family protein [Acidobacteriota bacterium]
MVFSSIEFLFLFLPLLLGLYRIVPRRFENAVLLLASLLFYTWSGGAFLLILLASIGGDYFAGAWVARAREKGLERRVAVGVGVSVGVNLGLLACFKYANFIVEQLNGMAASMGWGTIAWTTIGLPIGISFFTFQSMSYTLDLARGRAEHLRNPLDFALYVALFPQLICGPIVRYHEISRQIRKRRVRLADATEGAVRFVHGLVKKVVVADAAGSLADSAFSVPGDQLNAGTAWLGVIAYTLQIYFDFSGYSDMAIGLGRLFGFTFPENFRRPYSAISITDFWRRWHMTLSSWLRDYLYIPLGGSRGGASATYRNLVIVFLLCGLWHGANWTFVLWGAFHGALLVIERLTGQRPTETASFVALRRACVMLMVTLGWVIFRADSVQHAVAIYAAMFSFSGFELAPEVALARTHRVALVTGLAALVVLLPRSFVAGPQLAVQPGPLFSLVRVVWLGGGAVIATTLIASGNFSPFLYFQF